MQMTVLWNHTIMISGLTAVQDVAMTPADSDTAVWYQPAQKAGCKKYIWLPITSI
jgi:hypothetical protein